MAPAARGEVAERALGQLGKDELQGVPNRDVLLGDRHGLVADESEAVATTVETWCEVLLTLFPSTQEINMIKKGKCVKP